jgi:membrane-associated phospholipid phosphatase
MDFQISLIQTFQTSAPSLGGLMQGITFFGQPEFYLLFIPLILWCFDRSLGLRLLIVLSVSGAINEALKIFFHAPRPYWISPDVTAYTSMTSFGLPSGHAQNAVVFFGSIAAFARKWWIGIACIVIIFFISLSRIYQAVHFPTDIIAGWGIGILLLLGLLYLEKPVLERTRGRSFPALVIMAFGFSLLLIGITSIALFVTGPWQVPAEWSIQAVAHTGVPLDPFAHKDTWMTAGLIFGGLSGSLLCSRRFPFSIRSSAIRMAARYLLGIVILFLIWISLSGLAALPGNAGYLMTYIQAALAGFWLTAGAPALFLVTGLAHPEQHS